MHLKVGYVPFPFAPQLRRLAENVVAAHNGAHRWDRFAPKLIASAPSSLTQVSRYQQLYVFAFGNAADLALFAGDDEWIEATDLARQLREEGLTQSIRIVKLWASNSGAGGAASAAAQLKRAMIEGGFSHVSVYGYVKAVSDFTRNGHKVAADLDAHGRPINSFVAKSVRIRF